MRYAYRSMEQNMIHVHHKHGFLSRLIQATFMLVYAVLHIGLPKQTRNSVQLNFKPFKNARIFLSNARKSVLNILFKMKMSPKENTWPFTSQPLTVTKPFTRNLLGCPLNRGLKQ